MRTIDGANSRWVLFDIANRWPTKELSERGIAGKAAFRAILDLCNPTDHKTFNLFGIPIVESMAMPENELRFVDSTGRTLLHVVNLGSERKGNEDAED